MVCAQPRPITWLRCAVSLASSIALEAQCDLVLCCVYISGGRCVLGQRNSSLYIGTGYEEVKRG